MYKLFLCLRYLRSRVIAYFAVLGMALCVAMMLIVVSLANGFLNKLESAAEGLFGHVTISAGGLGGLAHYEQLAGELKDKVGEVQAVTPFISTVGLLRVPGYDYRKDVQIAGIRLLGSGDSRGRRTDCFNDVSDFSAGLFIQQGRRPSFDPPTQLLLNRIVADRRFTEVLMDKIESDRALLASARTAVDFHLEAERTILNAALVDEYLQELQRLRGDVDEAIVTSPGRGRIAELREAVRRRIEAMSEHYVEFMLLESAFRARPWAGDEGDLDRLLELLDKAVRELELKRFEPKDRRAILGLGIPQLIARTPEGQTIRKVAAGNKIILSLVPLGRKTVGTAAIVPVSANFTVVDDCRTDISSIDSNIIYLPFETLQKLNDLDSPDRCNQLLIKVRPAHTGGRKLQAVCEKVKSVVEDFQSRHPDMTATGDAPNVQSWAERLDYIVGPLSRQRTMFVIIFAVVSSVSVVLVFAIFYMIVVQKTRDIGVLKAIGASSGGVAGIFLAYGAAVGLVGAVLGTIGGYYFVRGINRIEDLVDRLFGMRFWQKEVFLFERIPNEVDPATALTIIAAAVVAGLVGAVVPAVRAARMQPVEALRYE